MNAAFRPCLLFFALLPLVTFGQATALDSLMRSRENASAFRDMLELVSEPATVSGAPLDYHSGIKKPYIFNGDFQLALTIGGPDYATGRKHKWVHALQFIPSTRVRLFQNDTSWQDKSKPVRTPSFYPRLYYFFSPEKLWNTENKRTLYFGLGAAHHSNGQDGTEFVDFTDTVNIYNGSFSESLIIHALIGGNLHFKTRLINNNAQKSRNERVIRKKSQRRTIFSVKEAYEKSNSLNWRLLYEYHPSYFANQKFHQHGVYGGNRIILNLTWINSRFWEKHFYQGTTLMITEKSNMENLRLSLNLEYITDLSYNSGGYENLQKIPLGMTSKRLNAALTAYKPVPSTRFLALFGQLAYYGSDNYNIYFQKSFFQARLGAAFAFFEYRKL
jgi:hypothetical protein